MMQLLSDSIIQVVGIFVDRKIYMSAIKMYINTSIAKESKNSCNIFKHKEHLIGSALLACW